MPISRKGDVKVLKNDPFEHIRRLQETITKMYVPFQEIQKQLEMVVNPYYDQLRMIQQTVAPMIEAIQNQQKFFEQLQIAEKLGANLRTWSEAVQALYNSSFLNVEVDLPSSIRQQLDVLEPIIKESVQSVEANADLKGGLEVTVPKSEKPNKLTWQTILVIISFLMQVFAFVEDHVKPNVVYVINQIVEFTQQHLPDSADPDKPEDPE